MVKASNTHQITIYHRDNNNSYVIISRSDMSYRHFSYQINCLYDSVNSLINIPTINDTTTDKDSMVERSIGTMHSSENSEFDNRIDINFKNYIFFYYTLHTNFLKNKINNYTDYIRKK